MSLRLSQRCIRHALVIATLLFAGPLQGAEETAGIPTAVSSLDENTKEIARTLGTLEISGAPAIAPVLDEKDREVARKLWNQRAPDVPATVRVLDDEDKELDKSIRLSWKCSRTCTQKTSPPLSYIESMYVLYILIKCTGLPSMVLSSIQDYSMESNTKRRLEVSGFEWEADAISPKRYRQSFYVPCGEPYNMPIHPPGDRENLIVPTSLSTTMLLCDLRRALRNNLLERDPESQPPYKEADYYKVDHFLDKHCIWYTAMSAHPHKRNIPAPTCDTILFYLCQETPGDPLVLIPHNRAKQTCFTLRKPKRRRRTPLVGTQVAPTHSIVYKPAPAFSERLLARLRFWQKKQ